MNTLKRLLFIAVVLAASPIAFAHEGHVHGPESGEDAVVSGPIELTTETIRNLGIETVEANPAPLQRSLRLTARIEGLPERQAKISSRSDGRVAEIFVKLGDRVTAGQQLVRFEPLTVGNPPVILKSPINGFVVRQDASIGQALTPETVLMEVADYSQVLARASTFETPDLSAIKVGQPAQVKLPVFGAELFEGKVQRLDVALEKDTGTFEIYVLLENPELKLRPNMQATATIGVGEAQDALAVPARAVLGDLGNYFVFVQTDDREFQRSNVVVGMRAGDQVEIVEGVLPGDKVVTHGNYQLQFAASAKKPEEADKPPADPAPQAGQQTSATAAASLALVPKWMWAALGVFAIAAFLFGRMSRRTA